MSLSDSDVADAAPPVPAVSVAIATRQRAQLLPALIRSLECQTLSVERFEVIIVDDGSTDQTTEVLGDLAHRSRLTIHVERFDSRRGPASARNAAWHRARSEIVAFTDDDCRPTPTWLERGLAAMHDGGEVVIGRTLPDPAQRDRLGPYSRTATVKDARFASSGNAFYRRGDLEAVGGFDEVFSAPGGEDTDLGWRIERDLSRRVSFAPDALVYHEIWPSDFVAHVKRTLRWHGIPLLVSLHPGAGRRHLHRRIFWKRTHPRVMMAAAGLALGFRSPVAFALTLPWLDYRLRRTRVPPDLGRRVTAIPGLFAIDLLEVLVMIRGSVRHRTLVL